jgi:hypothetical protein
MLAQRVDTLTRSVSAGGARFDRYIAGGFLTERQSLTTAIEIEAGSCVAIVAYASPGIGDLDARVYDDAGELLAEDVEPDSHPTVVLCAQEPRRVYHVLQAFEGDGAFVLAEFVGERRAMDALVVAVGGRPGTALSTRPNTSEGERRLLELRATLARRGFAPANDAMRLHFAASGRTSVPLQLTADRCFTVAAFADGASLTMRLLVLDSEGNLIARDARQRSDVGAQFCPGLTGSVTAIVEHGSVGSAVIQLFAADAASFGGGNTLWLGERIMSGVSSITGEARLAAARSRWTAAGYGPTQSTTISLAAAESREVTLTLEPNRCSLVAVAMGRGLARLSSALHGDDGELLARGQFADGTSTLVHCTSAVRERVALRVRADSGGGDVTWLVAAGPAAPSWTSGLARTLANEALAVNLAAAPDGWTAESTPEKLHFTPQSLRLRDATIPAGRCLRVVMNVGRLPSLATLILRGPAGEELARSRGEGTARVTHCATAAQTVRIEGELSPSVETDAVLQRFSRAASELSLGRGP